MVNASKIVSTSQLAPWGDSVSIKAKKLSSELTNKELYRTSEYFNNCTVGIFR